MNIDWLHAVLIALVAILSSLVLNAKSHTEANNSTPARKNPVNGEQSPETKITASQVLDFLLTVGNLKTQKRTGWVNHQIHLPESISDHMYRMAVMGLLVQTPGLNRHRLSLVSLSHDLAEAVVGDITPTEHSGVSEEDKHQLEVNGLRKMLSVLSNDENIRGDVENFWNEYEFQTTLEGQAAKELDKLEMLVQAYEYERDQRVILSGFYQSSEKHMKSEWARSLFAEIMRRREVLMQEWKAKGIEARIPTREK